MSLSTLSKEVRIAVAGVAVGVTFGIILEQGRKRWLQGAKNKSSSDVVKSGVDVHVDRKQLEKVVAACVEKCGASSDNASLVAEVLVAADCRGIPSHGVNRTEMYCGELRAGLIDPNAKPCIETETASTANIHANNGLGAVTSKFAMDVCMKKAKSTGVGLVVCHNSNHFGIAGYWPEIALREGLIGFAFTNTSPFLIPTRGSTRAGGTNPISMYCPAGPDDSFQLDMATTTVPVGKVEVCHRKGQKIPYGWGVDKAGNPTVDPAEVFDNGGLTPVGGLEETAGYKGYGLNMMVEILCAVLSGCKVVGPDVPLWNCARGRPVDYGHCFICIDPNKLLPNGGFQASLAAYLKRMRGLPRADKDIAVLVPGDPERAEEGSAKKNGVKLNEQVALGVRSLARELGVAEHLPEPIKKLPESKEAPKHAFAAVKK
jgi:LDH2 family malate/lactate/ureidoglycolate dehydrogenase